MQMKVCFHYQEFVSSSNLDPRIESKSAKMQEEDEDNVNEHARDASNIHTPSPSPLPPLSIMHGPVTVEQKSSFQSHVAIVRSMDQVTSFRNAVLEDKKVCMYACMYILYVCIYCMYMFVRMCACMCMYECMYLCMNECLCSECVSV